MRKDEILNDLHNKIMDGFYRPGDSLNERKLCENYGVSRTPIREVLWSMVSDDIVEHKKSKGFFVHKFTREQIFEVYQALEAIEGMTTRLACQYADEVFIDKLKHIKKELEKKDSKNETDACVKLGQQMDSEIVKAAKNETLKKIRNNLLVKIRLAVYLMDSRVLLEEQSRNYHLRIIQSIIEGNVDESEKYMHEHLQEVRNNLVKFLFPELSKILPVIDR